MKINVISHLVPSVPIIDSVNAMTLSLFAFRVNITLLTDGGQSVTLYTVSVHIFMYEHVFCIAYTIAYTRHDTEMLHKASQIEIKHCSAAG